MCPSDTLKREDTMSKFVLVFLCAFSIVLFFSFIFIDGIKVDNDKIEITNYESKNIAVNDDKKEIYIASRSKR